jgi:hypothetical protein
VHKSNRELLKWAGALCWFEPDETLSAEELKKQGNAAFGSKDFEGFLQLNLFIFTFCFEMPSAIINEH